jgi:mono/diheme cytochrome c family protein
MRKGIIVLRRMSRWAGGGLLVLVLGTVAYEYAAAYRPAAERSAILERGRTLYGTLCVDCHGEHMEGRILSTNDLIVPPLNKRGFRVFFYTMPAGMEGFVADRIASERAGVEGVKADLFGAGPLAMPAFGKSLSLEDRRALAVFIHAVNVGDAAAP